MDSIIFRLLIGAGIAILLLAACEPHYVAVPVTQPVVYGPSTVVPVYEPVVVVAPYYYHGYWHHYRHCR